MSRGLGWLLTVLFCLSCGTLMAADEPTSVGADLQAISVNIYCSSGGYSSVQGSGTIVLVPIGEQMTTWVLTAEHVVSNLRQVEDVINGKGSTRKLVTYRDAEIVQERMVDGRVVGERRYDAKVMSVNATRDVALLRVRIDGEFSDGATFYLGESFPRPGTALFHCGAPGGKDLGGTCSLTSGIVSRVGARIPHFGGSEHGVYDQITCPAMGGSSGGLIALQEDGRLVGVLTLGARGADSFHWMVPIRSILQWADEIDARWIFDPNAERPASEIEVNLPLEFNPTMPKASDEDTTAPAGESWLPWPFRGKEADLFHSIHVEK